MVRAALREAVEDDFLTYLPHRTAIDARSSFARFAAGRYGWDVDPARVHIVPDVLTALRITVEHFTDPEAPVIVPTPAYGPFLTLPVELGRRVIQIPSQVRNGRWLPDLNALDDALKAAGGLLVLCNPHNPLGTVLRRDEMLEIAEVVTARGGRVFSDEIHAPIVYSGATHIPYASISTAASQHTVTATAASKGWNVPGLKSAQMVLSADRDHIRWSRSTIHPTHLGSVLGAVAAQAAYSSEGVRWLDATVARFEANRDLFFGILADALPDVVATVPEATYLAWLDFSGTRLAGDPAAALRSGGVVTSSGLESGPRHGSSVRFNFALEPATLHEAVSRIAALLR